MASTDARPGFRLPWSSDRSHGDAAPAAPAESVQGDQDPVVGDGLAWPDSDLHARLGVKAGEPRPAAPADTTNAPEESPMMVETDTPAAPATPRKPSKLMADLSAAIRATAESARDQSLSQLETDAKQIVDAIRERSTDGAATLRKQTDEDIAAIREWSKAEIARIREETDTRIGSRKSELEAELAAHAAAVERRVEEVEAEVARFQARLADYFERLNGEEDPARLATMVEALPENPSFETWADLAVDTGVVLDPVVEDVEAVAEAPAPDEAVAEVAEAPAWGEPEPGGDVATGVAEAPAWGEPEASGEAASEAPVAEAVASEAVEAETVGSPAWGEPEASGGAVASAVAADPWGESDTGWSTAGTNGTSEGDVPRWADGETPEGFPSSEGGDPVDRGAIMAALEAAAEAVVAAESAAESADQAEAAADVAETAAELLVGRKDADEELDPEAQAALEARVDAGGYDTESFTDRLASLLPSHAEGAPGGEPGTTQVIVSGLVSVASIASFKRHLGRIGGVQAVAVASGPDGEFVFNVTHAGDVSFRDAVPTLPGFAARVTGVGDGTVLVVARDPEAES